jgi:hypothetical protein
MTMQQFISNQIAVHGQDYIDGLFDRNFVPVLTNHGWRWLYVSNDDYAEWLDNTYSIDSLVA